MIPVLALSKGAYNTAMARVDADIASMGMHINSLDTNLTNRIDNLQSATQTAMLQLVGVDTAISSLQNRIDNAEARITTVEAEGSPPEGYLTGTVGNYILHAKCSEAGNFTANVYLVYSRAFGCNGTYEECQQYFYSGINWTQGTPAYTTVITYNGTAWNLGKLWFNIGTFALAANITLTLPMSRCSQY
jgi:hypothetical protein